MLKNLKNSVFCIVFVMILSSFFLYAKSCVTYNLTSGRFGDHLFSYLRAEWIAYKYNIDLIYKSFAYSDELVLDQIYKNKTNKYHYKNIALDSGNINNILPDSNILYTVPYFPESSLEKEKCPTWNKLYFQVNWKDENFRKYILERIKPIKNIKTILPPENYISVAIHLREGGKYDPYYFYTMIPFKFPPMKFYIDALSKVQNYFKNRAIYCFVFTDSLTPESLISKFESSMNTRSIIFDCRKENNSPNTNVLEDFFSFFNFDVLIRPDSNFSMIPSLLHDFAMILSPKKITSSDKKIIENDFEAALDNDLILIKEFNIEINQILFNQLLNDPKYLKLPL